MASASSPSQPGAASSAAGAPAYGFGPFDATEAALLDAAARFAATVVAPAAGGWERERRHPVDALRAGSAIGLHRIQVPVDAGGLGLRYSVKLQVCEILAREDFGFAFAMVNAQNAVARIARDASDAQRERWLPGLLSGESLGAIALTEPGAGSDFPSIATRAVADGSGARAGWRLDGEKAWATNGANADHVLVYAQTDPSAGNAGIASFIVPVAADGVERLPAESLPGGHSIGACGFRLAGVRLDADALFYPPGEGFRRALASINGARSYVAAMGCGMVARALDLALDYAGRRQAFGQPLSARQGLRWMLADVATDLQAARLLTREAARLIDAQADAALAAAHAKKFATRFAERALRDCAQVLGAQGLRDALPIGRHLAGARIAHYVDGTTEMQNERIAALILRAGPSAAR